MGERDLPDPDPGIDRQLVGPTGDSQLGGPGGGADDLEVVPVHGAEPDAQLRYLVAVEVQRDADADDTEVDALARGEFLRAGLLPLLDAYLTPDLDGKAYGRFKRMKESYSL